MAKKLKSEFTLEQQLMDILVDVQRRNIGLAVSTNMILHLFDKYDECKRETADWLDKFHKDQSNTGQE
jgi:hypothetical protein